MFTYQLQIKLMSAVSQTPHTTQKKIIPQLRIIEAGHREKDRADFARGHKKWLSKNWGTYRPRWRSWVQFQSVPFSFFCKKNISQTAPNKSVGVSKKTTTVIFTSRRKNKIYIAIQQEFGNSQDWNFTSTSPYLCGPELIEWRQPRQPPSIISRRI